MRSMLSRASAAVAAAVIVSSLSASKSDAGTLNWVGGSGFGSYYDAFDNWTPLGPPTASDNAIFNLNSTFDVLFDDITGDRTNGNLGVEAGNVTFRRDGGSARTLTTGFMTVDNGATMRITDMTVAHKNDINLNRGSSIIVNAGGTLSSGGFTALRMGGGGTALENKLIIHNGGTVNSLIAYVGQTAGFSGRVSLDGTNALWNVAGVLDIGSSGAGFLDVTAGSRVNAVNASLGRNAGSAGTASVTGAGSTFSLSGNLDVGASGFGTLSVSDGGKTTAGTINVGVDTLNGNVNISGANSTLNATTSVTLGSTTGIGQLAMQGQARMGIGDLGVGVGAFAGALTVASSDLSGNAGVLALRNGSTVNHFGGSSVQVAGLSNSYGKIAIDGAGSQLVTDGSLQIGYSGAGHLELTNGGRASSALDTTLASFTGATGTIAIGTDSILTTQQNLYLGSNGGAGMLTIASGGRLNVGDGAAIIPPDDYSYIDDSSANATAGGAIFVRNGSALINNSTGFSLGESVGHSGKIDVSGPGSSVQSYVTYLGNEGKGLLNVSAGGCFTADGEITFGYNSSGRGEAAVDGNGSLLWSKGDMIVGNIGASSLTLTNGGDLRVGDATHDDGSYDVHVSDASPIGTAGGVLSVLNGSTLTSAQGAIIATFAGQSGRVVVDGANSRWTSGNSIQIAYGTGSVGEVRIASGGLVRTNGALEVGREGTGTLSISAAGRAESQFETAIGVLAGGNGTATVAGANSTMAVGTVLNVGKGGAGTLNINNGGKVTAANANVGTSATGVGTLNLSGSNSVLDVEGDLVVGSAGRGTVNLNAGSGIIVGDAATGTQELIVADSNFAGNAGGNVVLNNNSSWTMNDVVRLGKGAGKYGALKVNSGSTFSTNSAMIVGQEGRGVLSVAGGGTVLLNNTSPGALLEAGNSNGTGNITVDGVGSSVQTNSNAILSNGSTLTTTNGGRLLVGDNAAGFATDRLVIGDNNALGSGQGGVLTIASGSTLNHHSRVIVAPFTNTSGEIRVTGAGSQLLVGELLIVGNGGTGLVTVESGGRVKTDTYQFTSPTSRIIINSGGTFEANASMLAGTRGSLASGYNGGDWLGANGITSVTAQTNTRLGIGYKVTGALLTAKLVLKGDTDLNGIVNFDDLLALAQNYNTTGKFWSHGDFNYNGAVNFDDLLPLAQNYGQSGLALPADLGSGVSSDFAADWALALSMAPEPSSALVLLASAGVIRRRR